MSTQIGSLQQEYRGRSGLGYSVELTHAGLHKHRVIKGSDQSIVLAKARLQSAEWNEQWLKKRDAAARTAARSHRVQQAQADKEAKRRYLEEQKAEATRRTLEARALQERLSSALASTLSYDDAIDFESLKDRMPFPKEKPRKQSLPPAPTPQPVPQAPRREDSKYQPQLGFLDKLISSRRAAKEAVAEAAFEADLVEWTRQKDRVEEANRSAADFYARQISELDAAHVQAVRRWEAERADYLAEQARGHEAVDAFRTRYEAREPEAIVEYCDMVLAGSVYPECMPQEFELDFNPETGILAVDYQLPSPDDLPTLTEVKYVQSDDSFSEKHLTEGQKAKLYDELLYQVTLRTLHELFEADRVGVLKAIVFNGIVTSIDRGTGKETTACILSLQALRDPFLEINLANVDPKACFRQLKGVGSSKLHSVTAVAPILNVRREDGRFVAARDVAAEISEGDNLATMPWEDFEHLIREVFGREFSSAGGEVKVTRASRDGGVDAVAFDPDPIRGGKIVIQAKRYTNTVGVSAVRDLYGTVMNEGATKGILVTTSDYGPDAYAFANGKPITLLSGPNLLHLLEKHGVQARIDLVEARKEALSRSVGSS
jgi:restriction system protein